VHCRAAARRRRRLADRAARRQLGRRHPVHARNRCRCTALRAVQGVRHGPPEVLTRLAAGEDVDPPSTRFARRSRSRPRPPCWPGSTTASSSPSAGAGRPAPPTTSTSWRSHGTAPRRGARGTGARVARVSAGGCRSTRLSSASPRVPSTRSAATSGTPTTARTHQGQVDQGHPLVAAEKPRQAEHPPARAARRGRPRQQGDVPRLPAQEELRLLYALEDPALAPAHLHAWLAWASRSRLEPFVATPLIGLVYLCCSRIALDLPR
jgi:hypothetical protein